MLRSQSRMIQTRKENVQVNHIRNKNGNITTYETDIKKMREFNEKCISKNINSQSKMDDFLENFPKHSGRDKKQEHLPSLLNKRNP